MAGLVSHQVRHCVVRLKSLVKQNTANQIHQTKRAQASCALVIALEDLDSAAGYDAMAPKISWKTEI